VLDLHEAEIARLDELFVGLDAPHDVDLAVHATRKGIKRLRAHLRLARDAIAEDTYRTEDADLRDIGRLLAPARDAYVVGLTLESLESATGWEAADDYIEAHHRAAIDELLSGPLDQARTRLESVRERWLTHPTQLEASAVTDAVERSYRRGRVERETAMASGQAKAFHQWRKRVKYLRYQLEAIGVAEDRVAAWVALGEALGSEHDHTVFIDFCDDNIDLCPDRRDRYVLIDRAERRREELRASALGSDVYAGEPEAFVAVLG
jgi:CHAD domain-containing protein